MITITIDSWREYSELVADKFSENHWIFRGQSDYSWELISSIQRLKTKQLRLLEKGMLERYRSLIHIHKGTERLNDTVSYLAHMQHYGAQTRMLDFSESPFMAAFFAFERVTRFDVFEDSEYIAVWVINSNWLKLETINKLLYDDEFLNKLLDKTELTEDELGQKKSEPDFSSFAMSNLEKFFGDFFIDTAHTANVIYPIKPSSLSSRFEKQRGIFLCSSNIDIGFMKTLTGYVDYAKNVFQIRIPKNEREKAMKNFHQTGITRYDLFPKPDGSPSVDGLAQSLLDSVFLEN